MRVLEQTPTPKKTTADEINGQRKQQLTQNDFNEYHCH